MTSTLLINQMKLLNSIAAVSIAGISIASISSIKAAEVDTKMHQLCIEAKDYIGCIRAMKGETSTEKTVNQINRQGANLTEGNL